MTREEASIQIKGLKKYCEDMADSDESGAYVFDLDVQALDLALTTLRPITREQVEKVWRGEWEVDEFGHKCSKCGEYLPSGDDDIFPQFCPNCGDAKTDEAVKMVMDRLEALYEV